MSQPPGSQPPVDGRLASGAAEAKPGGRYFCAHELLRQAGFDVSAGGGTAGSPRASLGAPSEAVLARPAACGGVDSVAAAGPRMGPRFGHFLGLSGGNSGAAGSGAGGPSRLPIAQAGPVRELVPWPVPIRPLPMPLEPEPVAPVCRAAHDAAVAELKAARRRALEAGALLNRVVYDSIHFVPLDASRVPGRGLLFESRFESGNLRRAIHVQAEMVEGGGTVQEYDLLLNWDHGTRGHTQWFLFSVSAAAARQKYRFNIINFCKPHSLYHHGMRPLLYSALAAARGVGWRRGGEDILYFENGTAKRSGGKGEHSTLSFTWAAEEEGDTVYFAYCYPYTYTELCRDLTSIESDLRRAAHMRRKPLCTTIAGNVCEHVLVSDFSAPEKVICSRPVVALSARVHPGESNSSLMMRGILFFLTGDTDDARALRSRILFLIVPMLNPDGVVVGNYRCSLSAVDLNRRWLRPSARLHPTIHAFKKLLLRTNATQPVAMFVDLHGHSRKPNVFMYGCAERGSALLAQVFPLLLSKHSPRSFHFYSCSFSVTKAKECTARVVMHRELDLLTSYTLEASFCGADLTRPPPSRLSVTGRRMPVTGRRSSVSADAALAGDGPTTSETAEHCPADTPAVDPSAAAADPAPAASAPFAPASAALPSDCIHDAGASPHPTPRPLPTHFSASELEGVGADFCRSLVEFFGLAPGAAPLAVLPPDPVPDEREARRKAEQAQREATMSGVTTSAVWSAIQAAAAAVQAVTNPARCEQARCEEAGGEGDGWGCPGGEGGAYGRTTEVGAGGGGPAQIPTAVALDARSVSGQAASLPTPAASQPIPVVGGSMHDAGHAPGPPPALHATGIGATGAPAGIQRGNHCGGGCAGVFGSCGVLCSTGASGRLTCSGGGLPSSLPSSGAVQAALQELLLAGTDLLGDSDGSDGGAPSDDGGSGRAEKKKKKRGNGKSHVVGAGARKKAAAKDRSRDMSKEVSKGMPKMDKSKDVFRDGSQPGATARKRAGVDVADGLSGWSAEPMALAPRACSGVAGAAGAGGWDGAPSRFGACQIGACQTESGGLEAPDSLSPPCEPGPQAPVPEGEVADEGWAGVLPSAGDSVPSPPLEPWFMTDVEGACNSSSDSDSEGGEERRGGGNSACVGGGFAETGSCAEPDHAYSGLGEAGASDTSHLWRLARDEPRSGPLMSVSRVHLSARPPEALLRQSSLRAVNADLAGRAVNTDLAGRGVNTDLAGTSGRAFIPAGGTGHGRRGGGAGGGVPRAGSAVAGAHACGADNCSFGAEGAPPFSRVNSARSRCGAAVGAAALATAVGRPPSAAPLPPWLGTDPPAKPFWGGHKAFPQVEYDGRVSTPASAQFRAAPARRHIDPAHDCGPAEPELLNLTEASWSLGPGLAGGGGGGGGADGGSGGSGCIGAGGGAGCVCGSGGAGAPAGMGRAYSGGGEDGEEGLKHRWVSSKVATWADMSPPRPPTGSIAGRSNVPLPGGVPGGEGRVGLVAGAGRRAGTGGRPR